MTPEIVVTGFGPFGKFRDNPSDGLATHLGGVASTVLPVTYEAADRFARTRFPKSVRAIVMLGVKGKEKGKAFHLERRARNWVGGAPDVFGLTRGPGLISRRGPEFLEGGLFQGWEDTEGWRLSDDAGDYLCNYLYYRVLEFHPEIPSGFVHVLPFSVCSLSDQLVTLNRIVERVRAGL